MFILITCIQYCIRSFISELRQEVPFDYAKAFDCVDHNKLWKILKFLENSERGGNMRPPDLPFEKHMQVRKQQLELDMEQQTGSK